MQHRRLQEKPRRHGLMWCVVSASIFEFGAPASLMPSHSIAQPSIAIVNILKGQPI